MKERNQGKEEMNENEIRRKGSTRTGIEERLKEKMKERIKGLPKHLTTKTRALSPQPSQQPNFSNQFLKTKLSDHSRRAQPAPVFSLRCQSRAVATITADELFCPVPSRRRFPCCSVTATCQRRYSLPAPNHHMTSNSSPVPLLSIPAPSLYFSF
jgi:hypothetical protein